MTTISPVDRTVFVFFGVDSLCKVRLFRLYLGLSCVPVDSCLVGGNETILKLLSRFMQVHALCGILKCELSENYLSRTSSIDGLTSAELYTMVVFKVPAYGSIEIC